MPALTAFDTSPILLAAAGINVPNPFGWLEG